MRGRGQWFQVQGRAQFLYLRGTELQLTDVVRFYAATSHLLPLPRAGTRRPLVGGLGEIRVHLGGGPHHLLLYCQARALEETRGECVNIHLLCHLKLTYLLSCRSGVLGLGAVVASARAVRQALDLQRLGRLQQRRQLILRYVHLATVHVVHHGAQLLEFHIFQDEYGMLVILLCE